MATINDLNTSILQLSDEAATKLVLDVRASRRVTKKTTPKPQSTTFKKTAAPPKGLSQSATAALIKELEESMR
jgi:hypothetical protein